MARHRNQLIAAMRAGSHLDLADHRTDETFGWDKEAAKTALVDELTVVSDLQTRLFAEKTRALLVVLQAMDAGGKDGVLRTVMTGVNPAGVKVASFGVPSDEELDHDFLWRIHQQTPARGQIGVFNRSHYEDVLVVRVHELVPNAVWRRRYRQIREFERSLGDEGTTVVKLFLHLSKDEQEERLQARLDEPRKRWKFRLSDLDARAVWDDYQVAFQEMLGETSTEHAPWYVVPANKKWYRDWAVATIMVEVLERLDLTWPESPDDLSGVTIA